MNNDRRLVIGGLAGAGTLAVGFAVMGGGLASASAADAPKRRGFAITKSATQWRKELTPMQYYVLREAGTERPWSSALNKEKRNGTFLCAACDLPLYSSGAKYESFSGWPSFTKPLKGGVVVRPDYLLGIPRTEVLCKRCGGHLGHVFDDGPQPTGKRWCMNGAAMKFRPAKTVTASKN